MLAIDIPPAVYEKPDSWNGRSKKLIRVPAIHLELEHSLLSISRWESKWKIPFVECNSMTTLQFQDYVRCMTLNKQKDQSVYQYIRQCDAKKIVDYMQDSMTARVMKNKQKNQRRLRGSKVVMTSEYFYYAMIELGIPFECEKWHFGRLLALIDCCQNNSNSGGTSMNYRERQQFYNELNSARRKKLGTKG